MHSSKERLVNELNRLNTQAFLPTDVGFANPDALSGLKTRLTVVALSTGTIANAGQASMTYNRMDLETAFNMVGHTLSVLVGDSIHAILPSIRRYTGLMFDVKDIQDTAINWIDGKAAVEITAVANSLSWVGSTSLTLSLEPMQLSAVFRNPVVDMSTESVITLDKLYATEMRKNGVFVPYESLVFSKPVARDASEYNTEITITAKPGTGYTGSATFAYTRRSVGEVFGADFAVRDDATSAWLLIKYLVKLKGDIITADDLLDTAFSFTENPAPNTITAHPDSLTYVGTSDIVLQRRSDNTQTITLNFTQNDLALSPTAIQDGVVAQDNGQAFADVIINVAQNVMLIGASSLTPTFALDNFGTIEQTDFYINNLGSIYGRGGNGGIATNGKTAGAAGADAIHNAEEESRVIITNGGRIAGGGGGGGGYVSSSNSVAGGGGAPLGTSSNGNATLTNYTLGNSRSNYPYNTYGGDGGIFGAPGNEAYELRTSDGRATYAGNGGAAGVVISGELTNVSWVEPGIQVPFPTNTKMPSATYFNQTIQNVYLDPADSTKIAASFGRNIAAILETRSPYMAEILGVTEGTMGSDISNPLVYLVYLDNKFLLVPYYYARNAISWNTLYATGLVDGDASYGRNQPERQIPVKQYREIRLGRDIYSVRLFQGANADHLTEAAADTVGPTVNTTGSEWDRIMSLLVSNVTNAEQPGNKWTTYAAANWSLTSGAGCAVWTRERNDLAGANRRVYRGAVSGIGFNSLTPDTKTTATAWRPVFEWIEPTDDSEYQRFLAWLATNPAQVPLQLLTSAAMSTSPYFADLLQKQNGNPAGIYGQLLALDGSGSLNTMFGSPYGTYFNDNPTWGSIWTHAMPNRAAQTDQQTNKRVVLAFFKTNPKQSLISVTRNMYTSSAGTTSNMQTYALQLTQYVYFDASLGKMMQCDPSTMSTPVEFFFWVGDTVALDSIVTQRSLGTLPATTTDDNFLEYVVAQNEITDFAMNEVMFSDVVDYSGSEGNSKITITAQPGGRYSGSVDVYFTRRTATVGRAIPAQFQFPLSVPASATIYGFLKAFYPDVLDTYFDDVDPVEFDQTVLTFPAGEAPMALKVSLGSRYTGLETTTIEINPNQSNWWGADTLAAWDTSMFNAAGFNDALGNPMTVRSTIYAVAGTIAKSDQPKPVFGGAVQLYGSGIFTSAGRITPAQLQAAWTVDMWYYNTDDGYVATGTQNRLPLFLLGSTVNHAAAANASRLLIGSSSNAPGSITEYLNSLNPSIYGTTYAPYLQRKGWAHLALVYDGTSTVTIYNNGLAVATVTLAITGASATWETGVFGYVFGGTVPNVEVERWRFRSGVKITDNFDPNQLYAPNFSNPKALSSMVQSQTLSATPPENTNAAKFLKLVPVNGGPLDLRFITVSSPVAYTGSEGNTKVTLTAVSGGIYTGSVDIYFTRISMAVESLPTRLYKFADPVAFNNTTFAYLQQYFPDILTTNYPGRTAAEFDATKFVVAAGQLPTLSVALTPLDVWRYIPDTPIAINPVNGDWVGSDAVLAFDSNIYVQAGFTDKVGNTLKGYNKYAGTAGAYPTKQNSAFVFGGGLGMSTAMIASDTKFAPETFTQPFTIDMWVSLSALPAANATLPITFLFAEASPVDTFTPNDRLQIAGHDGTTAAMGVWNNATNAKVITSPNAPYRKLGWQHVAVTYDGSVFRYYCDGVLIATSAAYTVLGGNWAISTFSNLSGSSFSTIERYRYRKGVKIQNGYTVKDLYPVAEQVDLSVVTTQRVLGTPADTVNSKDAFVAFVGNANNTTLYPNELVVSNITDYTGSEGNSKATLSGVSGGRYIGTTTVYFTRQNFLDVPKTESKYKYADADAFSGTPYQYVAKYFPEVLSTYFSGRVESDFDAGAISVDAGNLPVLSVVLQGPRYRYRNGVTLAINPADANWAGTDVVTAWDSTIYLQSGFNDKAGNVITPTNTRRSTVTAYPTLPNKNFAFGGGIGLAGTWLGTAAKFPPETFTQPFTIDMWVFLNGTPTASGQLPQAFLYAETNSLGAFNANDRLQIAGHDTTVTGMSVWNNASTAKLITTPNTGYRKAGWQHMAVTYDGSVFRYYCDGVLLATSATYVVLGNSWQIGTYTNVVDTIYATVERYRFRKGVKLAAGYTVKDLYPTT